MTRLTLSNLEFNGLKLDFISAYTGKEAMVILQFQPDIAIILLDVVMETDYSGLEVVKFIEEELNNQKIQIILWTGQPRFSQENKVINSCYYEFYNIFKETVVKFFENIEDYHDELTTLLTEKFKIIGTRISKN